ncbi:MAG TPA: hypothetical protein VIL54_15750 [Natronosporangium sp.]
MVAVVAVAAAGGILLVQNLADAGGCSMTDGLRLRVAADPAVAPALREVAVEWTDAEEPEVNGACVAVEVTEAPTAEVAAQLAAAAGGVLDVAAGEPPTSPAPDALPHVWVPDSSYWVERVRSVSRSFFEPELSSLATSPIVLAVTDAGRDVVGEGPIEPAALREPLLAPLVNRDQEPPLPLLLSEPRRDTAGLVGAFWVQSAVVASDRDLPSLVAIFRAQGDAPPDTAALLPFFQEGVAAAPVSEQAVVAHNAGAVDVELTAVPVVDAPVLDFPYAIVDRLPQSVHDAAGLFLAALTRAPDVFTKHGFRAPDGTAGPGFPTGHGVTADPVAPTPVQPPEQFDLARRIWTSATSDARVLSVVNVNASMQETMLMPDGTPVTRLQVFQQAAARGLEMFTDGTDLGHWVYAARLDGEQDWVEGVPIELLNDEHKQRILAAIQGLQTAATDECALFETLLAAYREMKDGYDPSRSNTLVIWTDSGQTKSGGLTLEQTLRELERQADLTRPIRVILLGLGPDADMATLQALANATGGAAFQIPDPAQIETIFLRALLALPPEPVS